MSTPPEAPPETVLPSRRTRVIGGVQLVIAAAVCVALFVLHPAESGLVPECPFHAATGLCCPGCGSTRAAHHLLNLRLGEAWRHNPVLIVIGLPAVAIIAWRAAHATVTGRRARGRRVPAFVGWAVVVVVVAFFVARNVPGGAFDWLRPPG